MAFSLNKVMLIGHLGKDAETRFTTNNLSVSSFTLATSNSYKGKDGNWVNETTWHNITAFGLSDFMKENLKKGKKFYIEGRIKKRDYTDKDGIKRYATDIIAERLIPLESAASAEEGQEQISAPDVSVEENEDLPF